MVGASAGFVLAAGLTSTTVNESAQWYSVSTQAVAAFPTQPTVQVATVPNGVSVCASGNQPLGNGATINIVLGATNAITCTAGDFAEEFTLTSSATAAAGAYPMNTYTSYGTGPTTGTGSTVVTIATALTTAGTVNLYVDYGSVLPPPGGIASLDLIVQ